MSQLTVEVLSVSQRFESNADGEPQFLTDLLLFPEFSTFTQQPERARTRQLDLALELLRTRPPDELQRRLLASEIEAGTVEIAVAPSAQRHGNAWVEPATVRLPFLRWRHGDDACIAYVPSLGIEIVAPDAEGLNRRLPGEVRNAILREGFANSLLDLAYLQRGSELLVERVEWSPEVRTPVGDVKSQMQGGDRGESALDEVAVRLRPNRMRRAYERDALVERLAELLGSKRHSSILLVGPSGVGKSAIVQELVRRKSRLGLGGRPIYRTSGSRLVAGMCGFGMWQERCRRVIRESSDRRAILHLGSLLELMEVGQSTANSESIAAFLRPSIVRGQLAAIVECTPEQLSVIERREPKLLDAFRQLEVTEPAPEESRRILEAVAGARFTDAALRRADALHRRYSSYSAYPGRPLRFLERVAGESLGVPGRRTKPRGASAGMLRKFDTKAVLEAFSRESGMPPVLLSDSVPLDLERTRAWFRERISGQDDAVGCIVDTLAAIKANLNRPGKPLASFLFIGPTGIGKTELAKVLAEFLYQSRDRMIRLDMSEFNYPGSATRLISQTGIGGKEGLLTAKVREQPFSVILLDEFEKADPTVFDLFLQALGEARLTDGSGRVADFSNSVVIMTSNLGAREYQRGYLGFAADPDRNAIEHFTQSVKSALRPELFNRIDRIVPFLPLPESVIRRLVVREIEDANARDGVAGRGIQLDVDDAVIDLLVREGYDPRYGARPLRRTVERLLLHPVAELLAAAAPRTECLAATVHPTGRIRLQWRRRPAAKQADEAADGGAAQHSRAAARRQLYRDQERAANLRREYRQLVRSPLVAGLESELARLDSRRASARKRPGPAAGSGQDASPPATARRPEPLTNEEESRRAMLAGLLKRLEEEASRAVDAEEELVLRSIDLPGSGTPSPTPPGEQEFEDLFLQLYAAAESTAPVMTLLLTADRPGWLGRLAAAYVDCLRRMTGGTPVVTRYPRNPAEPAIVDNHLASSPEVVAPETIDGFLGRLPAGTAALGIGIRSPGTVLRFSTEPGVHTLSDTRGRKARCLVGMLESEPESIALLLEDLGMPDFNSFPLRRQFDESRRSYRDFFLKRRGRGEFSAQLLDDLLRRSLVQRARSVVP